MKKLLHQFNHPVQVALFSASISEKVREMAAPYLKNPAFLHTAAQTELNPLIAHYYIKTEVRDKFETLKKALSASETKRALVFVSQHTDTKVLVDKLNYHGFTVATISGKGSKENRKKALNDFKVGKVSILLSSDLSARGLDVAHITHIFHYYLPLRPEDYLHRSGRSGRNGHPGYSISLITPKDLGMIRILERTFKIELHPLLLVKGRMKDLQTESFLEPLTVEMSPIEASSKAKRNKYPKGFSSDTGKKANSKSNTPKQKGLKKKKKTASIENEPSDLFLSGTLADALKLIEEAQFDD